MRAPQFIYGHNWIAGWDTAPDATNIHFMSHSQERVDGGPLCLNEQCLERLPEGPMILHGARDLTHPRINPCPLCRAALRALSQYHIEVGT